MSKKIIHHLSHKLLVAMPHVKDELFEKSVVYVYEHDDQGAMAFIINKTLPISLGDILRQLKVETSSFKSNEIFLSQGGPVSKEQLYIIQFDLTDENAPFTLVQPQNLLNEFAKGEKLDSTLPFLGYAGWEAGQLEEELIGNDWLICPFSLEILTEVAADKRWEYCFKRIGVDPLHLSSRSGRA